MQENDYYNQIKELVIENEINRKVKEYSINRNDLKYYYKIGELLNDAGNKYGEHIVNKFSQKLIIEVGKKYDKSTLYKIRKYYKVFSSEKVAPLAQLLSWSHIIELLPLKDINKINYYINICNTQKLSKIALRERIKSKEYERLPESTKLKLINKEKTNIKDSIPEPILIPTPYNHEPNNIKEKMLQKLIMDNIIDFMKHLGPGYCLIENEYKIKINNNYNYIDILLFNYIYNCFVVLELKVTELKKEYFGQIKVYMNYIDKHLKKDNMNNTIGILLVKENNEYVLYSSDGNIITRTYELTECV